MEYLFAVYGIGTQFPDPIGNKTLGRPIVVGTEDQPIRRPLGHQPSRFLLGLVHLQHGGVEEASAVKQPVDGMRGGARESTKVRGDETRREARNV